MKKLLLSLSSIALIATPALAVVSCETNKSNEFIKYNKEVNTKIKEYWFENLNENENGWVDFYFENGKIKNVVFYENELADYFWFEIISQNKIKLFWTKNSTIAKKIKINSKLLNLTDKKYLVEKTETPNSNTIIYSTTPIAFNEVEKANIAKYELLNVSGLENGKWEKWFVNGEKDENNKN